MRVGVSGWIAASLLSVALAACSGEKGPAGAQGPTGPSGADAVVPTGAGFNLTIESANIAQDGTVQVALRATDASGSPVDVVAEKISLGFTAAVVPASGSMQPALPNNGFYDRAGTFTQVSAGNFTYTYASKIQVANATATYRVGVYSARSYLGVNYPSSATYDFVPAGGAPIVREIVTYDACNACHVKLTMHEDHGAPRTVKLCQTCHTGQLAYLMTAGQGQFDSMIHKIHMGANLKNGFVLAGTDFSKVQFPADSESGYGVPSVKSCTVCHQGATADNYKTKPARAACGACHDSVDFSTGANHPGGPQSDDTGCASCHGSATIVSKHQKTPGPKTELDILEVRNANAGAPPIVKFQVKVDGAPRDITQQPLDRIAINAAGPTSDYASVATTAINQANVTVVDAQNGVFEVTLNGALPADSNGKTWAFSLEGYLNAAPNYLHLGAVEPIKYVAVGGGTAIPRRVIVDTAKCNKCHQELGHHGGSRKNVQACSLCHNANNDNADFAPHVAGSTILPQSVQLDVMIHKIHAGKELSEAYGLGAYPPANASKPMGNQVSFVGEFPAGLSNCLACHNPGTYTIGLPSQAGALPNMRWEVTYLGTTGEYSATSTIGAAVSTLPQTAACTSCHDSPAVSAHAQLNTTGGVETCAICHGQGSEFDALVKHRVKP